jgi:hypothetical protein
VDQADRRRDHRAGSSTGDVAGRTHAGSYERTDNGTDECADVASHAAHERTDNGSHGCPDNGSDECTYERLDLLTLRRLAAAS